MLTAPISVLRDYTLIDVTDDALTPFVVAPTPARLDGEAEDTFAARVAAHAAAIATEAEAHRAAYDRAVETGAWDAIIVPGRTPTIFRIRQIGVTAWASFKRVARTLGQEEIANLAFRLGVIGIDNLNLGVKLAFAPFVGEDGRRERSFGEVLSSDIVDAIGHAPGGRDVVMRIGLAIMQQRGAPLGKL